MSFNSDIEDNPNVYNQWCQKSRIKRIQYLEINKKNNFLQKRISLNTNNKQTNKQTQKKKKHHHQQQTNMSDSDRDIQLNKARGDEDRNNIGELRSINENS